MASISRYVWPARSSIRDLAALRNARRKGKSGAIRQRVGYLPTADDQINGPVRIAQELFASANR